MGITTDVQEKINEFKVNYHEKWKRGGEDFIKYIKSSDLEETDLKLSDPRGFPLYISLC